jgi:hypothetical protein
MATRILEVRGPDGEHIGTGFVTKVKRESDNKEEWYLTHCRGGAGNALFPKIGWTGDLLKGWIKDNNYRAVWPAGKNLNFLPF